MCLAPTRGSPLFSSTPWAWEQALLVLINLIRLLFPSHIVQFSPGSSKYMPNLIFDYVDNANRFYTKSSPISETDISIWQSLQRIWNLLTKKKGGGGDVQLCLLDTNWCRLRVCVQKNSKKQRITWQNSSWFGSVRLPWPAAAPSAKLLYPLHGQTTPSPIRSL